MSKLKILTFVACAGAAMPVYALENKSSVDIPVSVRIIQCGDEATIKEMCRKEPICCTKIEPRSGEQLFGASNDNELRGYEHHTELTKDE